MKTIILRICGKNKNEIKGALTSMYRKIPKLPVAEFDRILKAANTLAAQPVF